MTSKECTSELWLPREERPHSRMQVISDYILALKHRTVDDMATFEELDGLLAEALQCLVAEAGLFRISKNESSNS